MHSRTKEKTQKHIEDMHQLALCYKRFLSEEKYRDWEKNLEDRIGLCVQSMLNSMLQNHYGKAEIESTIQTLKDEQLYPYKPLWFLLKPQRSIKHFFINCYFFIQQNERIFFLIERLAAISSNCFSAFVLTRNSTRRESSLSSTPLRVINLLDDKPFAVTSPFNQITSLAGIRLKQY